MSMENLTAQTAGGNPRRGAVSEALGLGTPWCPVPADWLAHATKLDKWAGRLADVLARLNGRRWRWGWQGSATSLWEKVITVDFAGLIGRQSFHRAWRLLLRAGLVAWRGCAWRCITAAEQLTDQSSPVHFDPRSDQPAPPKPRRAHIERERARTCEQGDLIQLPDDPTAVQSKQDGDLITDQEIGTTSETKIPKIRANVFGGGNPRPPRLPKSGETPKNDNRPQGTAPRPGKRWAPRMRALCLVVGKTWGPGAELRLQNQGGLWPRLQAISKHTDDRAWALAVAKLLERSLPPSAIASYLAAMLEGEAKREDLEADRQASPHLQRSLNVPQTPDDVQQAASGLRRMLAGPAEKCNGGAAHGRRDDDDEKKPGKATRETGRAAGSPQGVHPRQAGRPKADGRPGPQAGGDARQEAQAHKAAWDRRQGAQAVPADRSPPGGSGLELEPPSGRDPLLPPVPD